MNAKEVQRFVLRYLDATGCEIREKSPAHVTVKLSPEADKDLTNRPFYWSFVERTGTPPETMTMTFVFDPEWQEAEQQKRSAKERGAGTPQGASSAGQAAGESILSRYFGFAPAAPQAGRMTFEEMTYGSRKLEQLFSVVKRKGRFVQMYENAGSPRGAPLVYKTWLAVNYKVEFICDMKREELHSLGISLATGEIVEDFMEKIEPLPLTPRMAPNTLVQRPVWSVARAAKALEEYLAREIAGYNHDWAKEAKARYDEEIALIDAYYKEIQEEEAAAQYEARKREIEWQYAPRIEAAAVSAGVFHLAADTHDLLKPCLTSRSPT